MTEKSLTDQTEEFVANLKRQYDIPDAGVDGWIDPESPAYKASLTFATQMLGLKTRKPDGSLKTRGIKYMSEWPDRFGGIFDFYVFDDKLDVLQGKRSTAVQHAGKFCVPGGSTEDVFTHLTSFLEVGVEELRDETGLTYTVEELRQSIFTVWQYQGNYHLEMNKRFIQATFVLMPPVEKLRMELKRSTREMEELTFVAPQDVLSDKVPQAFPDIQPVMLSHILENGYVQRLKRLADIRQTYLSEDMLSARDLDFLIRHTRIA